MVWIQQKIKINHNKNKESDNVDKQCHLLKDGHEVGWQMYLAHLQFQQPLCEMTMDLKHALKKPSWFTNQNHSFLTNYFYFYFSKMILFSHCLSQASMEFCIWVKFCTPKKNITFISSKASSPQYHEHSWYLKFEKSFQGYQEHTTNYS